MDGKTKANVENVFIGSFFPVLLSWGKQSLPNHSEIKSFIRAANKTDRCRLRFLNTICILVLKRSKHERQLYAGRETKDVSKG